jgi:hypothetical protein
MNLSVCSLLAPFALNSCMKMNTKKKEYTNKIIGTWNLSE